MLPEFHIFKIPGGALAASHWDQQRAAEFYISEIHGESLVDVQLSKSYDSLWGWASDEWCSKGSKLLALPAATCRQQEMGADD